ncbi:MAG TPA: glycine cleavage system protein GcvH [Acidiferrobacteraceae bacterium]|nr:glycine cleavage system protein GcvH [Acidiferrobacteraceae bacterium]
MSHANNDLRYTQSHEWVIQISDGAVEVGITDYAQDLLGDMVYIDLPEVGDNLTAGKECAVVESVKAASDIFAPISGEVSEINEVLSDTPEILNQDAQGGGWLFRMIPSDAADLNGLLDADAYQALVEPDAG